MTHSPNHFISSEEAVSLGQILGLHPDVSVYASQEGVMIGDTYNWPPVSLNTYLGNLCASDQKPYFVPSNVSRDALVLSLGYAYSTKMHQAEIDIESIAPQVETSA